MMAALTVLYSHHFALTSQAEPSFLGLYSWGGAAVIVFFVISGYLVTSSWYNDPNVLRFSLRRFLRIWPALTVVVICTAYVLGAYVTTLPLHTYWTHGATAAYLRTLAMQVHFVLPGVFEENPYARGVNGSLWTIPWKFAATWSGGWAGLPRRDACAIPVAMLRGARCNLVLVQNQPTSRNQFTRQSELSAFSSLDQPFLLKAHHRERRPSAWILAASIGAAHLVGWLAHRRTDRPAARAGLRRNACHSGVAARRTLGRPVIWHLPDCVSSSADRDPFRLAAPGLCWRWLFRPRNRVGTGHCLMARH
ncbi:MAG: acyltransferase [Ottowia sp.]|nr:acyltransferase [Ottowia sp.]